MNILLQFWNHKSLPVFLNLDHSSILCFGFRTQSIFYLHSKEYFQMQIPGGLVECRWNKTMEEWGATTVQYVADSTSVDQVARFL